MLEELKKGFKDRLGNDQDIEFQDIKIGVFQDC